MHTYNARREAESTAVFEVPPSSRLAPAALRGPVPPKSRREGDVPLCGE
jgi:hypothetical protein